MDEPRPHAPTHEDQGGTTVTTNNDTPRIFSDGASDDADVTPVRSAASGAANLTPRGSAGRGNPSRPDGYPQPSSDAADEGHPGYPGYPGYPGETRKARVTRRRSGTRGSRSIPADRGTPCFRWTNGGYPAGPGYVPDSGYAHDLGYPHEGWYEPASPATRETRAIRRTRAIRETGLPGRASDGRYLGYAPEPGYGRDPEGIPPMESLLEAGHAPRSSAPSRRPGPALASPGRPGSVPGPGRPAASPPPPSRGAPAAPAETSDSLTAESLLNGKRPRPGPAGGTGSPG